MKSRLWLWPILAPILVIAEAILVPAAASADGAATTLNFSVTRNGDRIGTSTVRLRGDGGQTVAEVATHVQVTFASFTLYRFDQRETERWRDGALVAMSAVTDDNGTVHKVTAVRSGGALSVDADGTTRQVDPAAVPLSLWNPSVVRQKMALDPQDGRVTPLSVVDRGEERLVVDGHVTTVHHYSLDSSFPQDVWYDHQDRLVKIELRGADGSTIRYRLG